MTAQVAAGILLLAAGGVFLLVAVRLIVRDDAADELDEE